LVKNIIKMKPRNSSVQQQEALRLINNHKQTARPMQPYTESPQKQQQQKQTVAPMSPLPLPREVKEECEQIMLLQKQKQLHAIPDIYPCGLCAENFLSKQELVQHFLVCCRSVCSPPRPLLPPISQERSLFNAGLNLRSVQQPDRLSTVDIDSGDLLNRRCGDRDSIESACISPDSELFWQPMLAVSRVGVTSEFGCRVPGLFPRQIVDPHGYEKFCAAAPGSRFPTGRIPATGYSGSSRIDRLRLSSRYCHFWSYQGCKSRVLRARREKKLTKIIKDCQALKRRQLLKQSKQPIKAAPQIKDCSVVLERLPVEAFPSCSVVLNRLQLPSCSVALTRIDEQQPSARSNSSRVIEAEQPDLQTNSRRLRSNSRSRTDSDVSLSRDRLSLSGTDVGNKPTSIDKQQPSAGSIGGLAIEEEAKSRRLRSRSRTDSDVSLSRDKLDKMSTHVGNKRPRQVNRKRRNRRQSPSVQQLQFPSPPSPTRAAFKAQRLRLEQLASARGCWRVNLLPMNTDQVLSAAGWQPATDQDESAFLYKFFN
ncbi:hypothetical protein BOX15_Mlig032185g1, partial [Macrostomum lignano]